MMRCNVVGNTGIRLSAVGFGTAQLRLVPERQAIESLRRSFESGVNWVHTAPDYGGAEVLVARAIAASRRRDILVLSNASGPVEHFAWVFEHTCQLLGRKKLAMFGISGIDYCEEIGQNVWGTGGLVEFLQECKRSGRLQGLFCTTHGSPEYVARLITSGVFDAVMLAYNPLGFHVLSYYGAAEGKAFEDLTRTRDEIFPLARKHNVSLLIMKPLAGGLLCPGKAIPPRARLSNETVGLRAPDILRAILLHPEVCAVVPGTACVEEAEENARAGYEPIRPPPERLERLDRSVAELQSSLCSRCGVCESTCGRSLPISWLFREGYIWNYPSHTFEALDRLHYFRLHENEKLTCDTCTERGCVCPQGLDIPASLARVHENMLALREAGLIHATAEELARNTIDGHLPVRVVCREVPRRLGPGQRGLCRLWIENAGPAVWASFVTQPQVETSLALAVFLDGRRVAQLPLMHDVAPGQRTYFAFEVTAPRRPGPHTVQWSLVTVPRRAGRRAPPTSMPGATFDVDGVPTGTARTLWQRLGRLAARSPRGPAKERRNAGT